MADPTSTPNLNDLNAATQAAQRLGLPLVRLSVGDIQRPALATVPEKLAREYRLIPVSLDGATRHLTIAIADPSLLSQPAPDFLQKLKSGGYTLELQVTPASDFQAALAAYGHVSEPASSAGGQSAVSSQQTRPSVPAPTSAPVIASEAKQSQPQKQIATSPVTPRDDTTKPEPVPASVHSQAVPPVSLQGKTIPLEVLERFPQDVATKYQMVVFEVSPDGQTASVAAANPGDRRVREILKFVEERNGIRIQLFKTTPADLKTVLSQYPKTELEQSQPKKPTEATKPQIATVAPPAGGLPRDDKPSVDVPLKRASADELKKVAAEPKPVAPPLSPKVSSAGPVVPGVKLGGMTPAFSADRPALSADRPASPLTPTITPSQYQQAVTRNSAVPPSGAPKAITQINASDIQTQSSDPGQGGVTAPVLEMTVEERNLDTILGGVIMQSSQLEEVVKSGMIPRIIAAFISYAVGLGASDIHLEAAREYVRLRYRIDGALQEVVRLPITLLAPLVSRLKILSKLKIDESRVPQDGRFDVQVSGHEIDLRVSTLPTVFGEKVVLRILDKSAGIKKLEELGIAGTNLERLRGAIRDPYGIILVTGPTGSGKTSTLYAVLNELNTPAVNIVTLEDPVEYQLEGINQTQVKPAIGFGFADGLRSILRQDPNIVMVGEIRDKETAALATQAALTGHLVLSTLHTNDAAGAIPRMLDMGVEPFLLASSLKAIVGQRLVRRLVPESKAAVQIPAEMVEAVKSELSHGQSPEAIKAASSQLSFYGPGANAQQGYHGRVGIYEVLPMSPAIADLTLKKAADASIAEAALAEGMVTMRQDGIIKAAEGATSLDEVLQATAEK